MNFYKHHIGDYAAATSHLSILEDGVYSRLLRIYYRDEKPLPSDLRAVQRLACARSEDEREAVTLVLEEFFVQEEDGWHSKRCDEEIAKANVQAETNRRIAEEREARKRARFVQSDKTNRGESSNEASTSDKDEASNESTTNRQPSQTPDSRLQTRAESKPLERQAARFAEFWQVYPVKKGKAAAEAKWKSRKLDAIADQIIADVKARIANDRQWLDGYAPHASTYVNGRGWEDEIERPKANGQRSANDIFAGAQ